MSGLTEQDFIADLELLEALQAAGWLRVVAYIEL